MRVPQLRRLLSITITLCIAGIIATVLLAILLPVSQVAVPAIADLEPKPAPSALAQAKALSLVQQFLPHWKKRLRRPLVDPPPESKPEPKVIAATSKQQIFQNLELLGTIIDGDETWALLQTGLNRLEVCKAGDKVTAGNVALEVLKVEDDCVLLKNSSTEFRLALKAPPKSL